MQNKIKRLERAQELLEEAVKLTVRITEILDHKTKGTITIEHLEEAVAMHDRMMAIKKEGDELEKSLYEE